MSDVERQPDPPGTSWLSKTKPPWGVQASPLVPNLRAPPPNPEKYVSFVLHVIAWEPLHGARGKTRPKLSGCERGGKRPVRLRQVAGDNRGHA